MNDPISHAYLITPSSKLFEIQFSTAVIWLCIFHHFGLLQCDNCSHHIVSICCWPKSLIYYFLFSFFFEKPRSWTTKHFAFLCDASIFNRQCRVFWTHNLGFIIFSFVTPPWLFCCLLFLEASYFFCAFLCIVIYRETSRQSHVLVSFCRYLVQNHHMLFGVQLGLIPSYEASSRFIDVLTSQLLDSLALWVIRLYFLCSSFQYVSSVRRWSSGFGVYRWSEEKGAMCICKYCHRLHWFFLLSEDASRIGCTVLCVL